MTTDVPITTTTALPNDNGNSCPIPSNLDDLTQNQFSQILTNDCRYDKLTKPHSNGPLEVDLQIDVRHIEAADQLVKFKLKKNNKTLIISIIFPAIKNASPCSIQLFRREIEI